MKMKTYRNDIDGLRAIAVICVILFHLGYLTNGYLGVDVFFTISGYLITIIIYKELQNDKFSIYLCIFAKIDKFIKMKIFNFLKYLVVFAVIVSCGSDKEEVQKKAKSPQDIVQLIVEFKSLFNDKFEVYYTVEQGEMIKGDYRLESYVYGSNEMQKIVFDFPTGELPYKIRLDVGENQSVNQMTIKNISVKYKDKLIDGDYGKFMVYYNLYESIKYNKETFMYEFVSINGKKDPFLFSNEYMDTNLLDLYN